MQLIQVCDPTLGVLCTPAPRLHCANGLPSTCHLSHPNQLLWPIPPQSTACWKLTLLCVRIPAAANSG
jgi:hypothetical protein